MHQVFTVISFFVFCSRLLLKHQKNLKHDHLHSEMQRFNGCSEKGNKSFTLRKIKNSQKSASFFSPPHTGKTRTLKQRCYEREPAVRQKMSLWVLIWHVCNVSTSFHQEGSWVTDKGRGHRVWQNTSSTK